MCNILDRYGEQNILNNLRNEELDLEVEELSDESETVSSEEKSKRKLYVDKVDKSTSDLYRMIIEGELILQPEYQRNFVWTTKTMSKFIESLLLSIPIPTIFLAENKDDTYEVIDGQQRLTTIFAFMKDGNVTENPKIDNELKEFPVLTLNGLETLDQYNRKTYKTFEDSIRRKFNNVSVPVVIIKKDSTEDIKYDIFSRINSGSVKLNSQELLNVMYRGTLIKKLNEVALDDKVDEVFGNRPILKKRFGYQELLLRAKVMCDFIDEGSWKLKSCKANNPDVLGKEERKYSGLLNKAILEYLKDNRNDEIETEKLACFVRESVSKVLLVFGESAFKRGSLKNINKSIAELQLVILSHFTIDEIEQHKSQIKASFDEFVETVDVAIFTRTTNSTSNVEKRYEWGKIVSGIIRG